MEKGLADGRIILTGSTHVKAGASAKKNMKISAERETTGYMERPDRYEAEERERPEASGAIKPKRTGRVKKPRTVERTVNATDPDSGLLGRPGRPGGMHTI